MNQSENSGEKSLNKVCICPKCGVEVNCHVARCPRCDTVIDAAEERPLRESEGDALDPEGG